MAGELLAPIPGGGVPVRPARFIPPLPAGIPILPGQLAKAKSARRLPVGLMVFLVVLVFALLLRWWVSYSDYDKNQIDHVMTRAMIAHVPKGTLLPVTLRGGARVLQIVRADVKYQGQIPTTCVYVKVLDPKTGAQDPKAIGELTCIEGLKYPLH
jgi:hypothetical protein